MTVVRCHIAGALAAAVLALLLAASGVAAAGAVRVPGGSGPMPGGLAALREGPGAVPAAGCAASVLASLTEAQRIGELFLLGFGARLGSAERQAIARFHYGSLTFDARTGAGRSGVRAVTDTIQAQATGPSTGSVRFLIAANQEGGLVQALTGTGFDTIPTALAQGRLTTDELRAKADRWGTQLRKAGVNLDLAPVADVVPPGTASQNAPIGALDREFGHHPPIVASHVKAFLRGMTDAGVSTSLKHFPGLGRVRGNTDVTAGVEDTVTTRHDAYLTPFAQAIDAGAPLVMVSLATYTRIDPDHLAAFSKIIITGMLRGDLGFDGVIVSDDLAASAVQSIDVGDRAVKFLVAGGDLITITSLAGAGKMAQHLASRAAAKPAFRERIDGSVLRILRAKQALGLLPCEG